MQVDDSTFLKQLSKNHMETVIRIGLIAFLVVMCVYIFAPFMKLLLWSLILAIALYPLQQFLARRLKGRQGRAATLLVLGGLLLVGVPTVLLGASFAHQVHDVLTANENNELSIKKPDPAVADWPLVGPRVYSAWNSAADNMSAYLEENKVQFKSRSKRALSIAANTVGSIVLFLVALIVAGIMMAYGEPGSRAMGRIFTRLAGPSRGKRLQSTSTATVRSVASGVIGVAFIQALLMGVGFLMADIPAAGILAVVVLLLSIMQVSASLISIPAIAYLWWTGDGSTVSNIVYSIYLLAGGLADNFLKPLLLGRGVDAPMPIILLGALGGMVSGGISGMFVGAVVLTIGYQIFMEWVENVQEGISTEKEQGDTVEQPAPASEQGQGS